MEPLDYATPAVNREAARRQIWRRISQRVFTKRNVLLAIAAIVVLVLVQQFLRWQATWPRDWDIRVADFDGRDIAIATGMQVHKFHVKLPDGKWDISVHLASYRYGSTVPVESQGFGSGGVEGGTHIVWFYVPDNPGEDIRVNIGGGASVQIKQPQLISIKGPMEHSYGATYFGKLMPAVPFVVWFSTRDSRNLGIRPGPPPPDEHEQTVFLTLTVSPHSPTFSPTTSPGKIVIP